VREERVGWERRRDGEREGGVGVGFELGGGGF